MRRIFCSTIWAFTQDVSYTLHLWNRIKATSAATQYVSYTLHLWNRVKTTSAATQYVSYTLHLWNRIKTTSAATQYVSYTLHLWNRIITSAALIMGNLVSWSACSPIQFTTSIHLFKSSNHMHLNKVIAFSQSKCQDLRNKLLRLVEHM